MLRPFSDPRASQESPRKIDWFRRKQPQLNQRPADERNADRRSTTGGTAGSTVAPRTAGAAGAPEPHAGEALVSGSTQPSPSERSARRVTMVYSAVLIAVTWVRRKTGRRAGMVVLQPDETARARRSGVLEPRPGPPRPKRVGRARPEQGGGGGPPARARTTPGVQRAATAAPPQSISPR